MLRSSEKRKAKGEKRKAKSEKRKAKGEVAKGERRKAKGEKRKAKSEKRTTTPDRWEHCLPGRFWHLQDQLARRPCFQMQLLLLIMIRITTYYNSFAGNSNAYLSVHQRLLIRSSTDTYPFINGYLSVLQLILLRFTA